MSAAITKIKQQKTRSLEAILETIVGKVYIRFGKLLNPLRFTVNKKPVKVFHERKWEHIFAIYQCFYKQQYELPRPLFVEEYHKAFLEARYGSIVASGRRPLIVDCGANIGASAVWFSGRYPEAKIVAIEPAPDNIRLLRRNVAEFDVDVVEAAVGLADGHSFLDASITDALGQRVAVDGGGTQVQVLSLSTIVGRHNDTVPFFLKVDIEGAEKTLFEGGWEILDRFPIIALEPHDFCIPGDRISSAFFRYHASRGRDFLFANENIFSIKYESS
jgi:FkbM family methyltransferase